MKSLRSEYFDAIAATAPCQSDTNVKISEEDSVPSNSLKDYYSHFSYLLLHDLLTERQVDGRALHLC